MPTWIFLLLFALCTSGCFGCATVTSVFDATNPRLAGASLQMESVVIIWDSKTHTEHFIRKADFATNLPEIGFLVPTPTVPDIVEVDPKIFEMAEKVSGPTKVPRLRPLDLLIHDMEGMLGLAGFTLGKDVTSVFSAINRQLLPLSVKEEDVAGYHATVLDASNVDQLKNWLLANKFNWDDKDEAWLAPYIKKHWKITAFQLINPTPSFDTGIFDSLDTIELYHRPPFFSVQRTQVR